MSDHFTEAWHDPASASNNASELSAESWSRWRYLSKKKRKKNKQRSFVECWDNEEINENCEPNNCVSSVQSPNELSSAVMTVKSEDTTKKAPFSMSHYAIAKLLAKQCCFAECNELLYKYIPLFGYFKPMDGIALHGGIKMAVDESIRPLLTKRKIEEVRLEIISDPNFHMKLREVPQGIERFVNFKNGVYDLTTGKLNPHSPAYGFRNVVNVSYNSKLLKTPLPLDAARYFSSTCGEDKNLIYKVQLMLGLALSNDRSAKVGFFLIGKANTGKSTLLSLIRQLVGEENVSSLSLADFSKSFRIEQAQDKLCNLISELSQEDLKGLDILKTIIGNQSDKIIAERKFERAFSFTPRILLIAGGNDLPRIPAGQDPDGALRKRIYIIHLTRSIPPEERRSDMLEVLLEYRQHIVHWALQGLLDYKANGLPPNEDHYDDIVALENDDGLKRFFDISSELSPEAWTSSAAILEAYMRYCDEKMIEERFRASKNRIAAYLKSIPGVEKSKRQNSKERQGHGFFGIYLKDSSTDNI